MADFVYKYAAQHLSAARFDLLYRSKLEVAENCCVFYNEGTTTHIAERQESITILGYVYYAEKETQAYLSEVLHHFDEAMIPEIKKNLSGQYIALIRKGSALYLFADFLQVRSIYYSPKKQTVSSSFDVAGVYAGDDTDPYKRFEFAAMRHCLYPAWLGNTTHNKRLLRLRAFEYLKIDLMSGSIETHDFQITIDNTQEASLAQITTKTLALLRKMIHHPAVREQRVCSTITGGFDSRLVTALAREYYHDVELRTSIRKGEESLDYTLSRRVAEAMSMPLTVYEADIEQKKEWFYFVTEGLMPKENAIVSEMLRHTGHCALGFGGAFGTELYTMPPYNTASELITDYLHRARHSVQAEESYYERFEQALQAEFEAIRNHYTLAQEDDRSWLRLLRLINTAYFSSPVVSAFNIYGNQFEIFGAFPVVELGLKIPYRYFGSRTTFGRFYLIPKILMEHIDRKLSKIDTTHFCPMRPLSFASCISYFAGKLRRKKYYAERAKMPQHISTLSLVDEGWTYRSNDWIEGFNRRHLPHKSTN